MLIADTITTHSSSVTEYSLYARHSAKILQSSHLILTKILGSTYFFFFFFCPLTNRWPEKKFRQQHKITQLLSRQESCLTTKLLVTAPPTSPWLRCLGSPRHGLDQDKAKPKQQKFNGGVDTRKAVSSFSLKN